LLAAKSVAAAPAPRQQPRLKIAVSGSDPISTAPRTISNAYASMPNSPGSLGANPRERGSSLGNFAAKAANATKKAMSAENAPLKKFQLVVTGPFARCGRQHLPRDWARPCHICNGTGPVNRTVCNARTQSARMQRARLGAIVSTLSASISTLFSAIVSTLISGLSARLLAALPKVACSRHGRSLSDLCAATHGSMVGVGLGATRRSQLLAGLAVYFFCTLHVAIITSILIILLMLILTLILIFLPYSHSYSHSSYSYSYHHSSRKPS
jgi:hypothetical protein